ncbi:DUF1576 domain-containing protein [Enterococcus dongliensis]|uniref:DUF1576 domain-containing protein n=1 Tax=Enterococcus dongliensis TaxID=2559925 RepID=UPI00288C9887|nr:DUF1576 domain-containing protein [Enterococcus dongliensis]MDT2640390.1 DUF1576 domain-containing protein [Enterococcus dongliensis]
MEKTDQALLSTKFIFIFLLTYASSITIAAFFLASPQTLFLGMRQIIASPSNLITDYVHIAGVGPAFLNSGLLTLSSLFLLRKHRHHFCSLTVSVIMMLSGFSFFGKNIINSAPIIIGCLVYLRIHHSKRQDLLVMGLLGTCLSPIVSTIYCTPSSFNKLIALAIGLLIGYTILPIFEFLKGHTAGFSMYNFKFHYFLFPALGVLLTAQFIYQDLATTNSIFIFLFASTLSPMTRKYGLLAGTMAGLIFSLITRNTHPLTAGINLYNCGFSGGVTVLLLDFIRALFYRNFQLKQFCQKNYHQLIFFEKSLLTKFQLIYRTFFLKCIKNKERHTKKFDQY